MTAAVVASIFSSIGHSISVIFHPFLVLFATILAFIYAVIPNYAIAIAVLTIVASGKEKAFRWECAGLQSSTSTVATSRCSMKMVRS